MKTNENNSSSREESIFYLLEKQYQEAANKEEIDYWKPLSKIIVESIELRDSKQMSQADLAKKMKTTQSVISRFENLGRLPNYDFISRIATALGQRLGVTLYGDFMAIVPIEKQDIVKKLANEQKVTTREYLQNLMEYYINIGFSCSSVKAKKIQTLKVVRATAEGEYVQNKKQEDNQCLTSLASCWNNDITVAS